MKKIVSMFLILILAFSIFPCSTTKTNATTNTITSTSKDVGISTPTNVEDTKVDKIFTNGRIYTVDEKYPWASTLVIKNGKFVYVGDEKGASKFEGPKVDLKGQFVMPGIIDSHIHLAWGSEALVEQTPGFLWGENKSEVLEALKKYLKEDPDAKSYKFVMYVASLNGEKLTRKELDEICPDKPLLIVECEQHSRWMNTKEMAVEHIDENMPDIAPGLSFCERDAQGKINGRIYEFCGMANLYTDFSKKVYEDGMQRLWDQWKKWGVVAAFDAGQPSNDVAIDNFFSTLVEKDKKGEMPTYIEGCFYVYNPKHLEYAIKRLKEYNAKYNTDHIKVRTMKIMLDGTANGHTAAFFDNYADVQSSGATLLDVDTLTKFIIELNEEGIDLHVHSIGDKAIATVLDSVENAKTQLGDKYKIQVTCAHLEYIRDEDYGRFAQLGVYGNFTPCWFGGNVYESYDALVKLVGKQRADHSHCANTLWNTGANISFSSDSITLGLFKNWDPYVGIETGITRQNKDDPFNGEDDFSQYPIFPSKEDRLSLDKMIKGYTINGAKQMKLDDKIGSIEVGKDASFLVFEQNLFDLDVYQLHKQLPKEFYIRGELVKQ